MINLNFEKKQIYINIYMDKKKTKKYYDRQYYLNVKRIKYYKDRYNIDIINNNIVKIEMGPFTLIF